MSLFFKLAPLLLCLIPGKTENYLNIPLFQEDESKTTLKDVVKILKPGDKLVVSFTEHWCPPCQKQKPSLEKLDADIRKKSIGQVLFIQQEKPTGSFKGVLDKTKALSRRFKVEGIPTNVIFVVTEKGDLKEIHRCVGARNWQSDPELQKIIFG